MEKTYNPALIQRTQRYMETHSISQNQFAAKKCFCKTSFSAHALEDVQCTIYAPVFFCLN